MRCAVRVFTLFCLFKSLPLDIDMSIVVERDGRLPPYGVNLIEQQKSEILKIKTFRNSNIFKHLTFDFSNLQTPSNMPKSIFQASFLQNVVSFSCLQILFYVKFHFFTPRVVVLTCEYLWAHVCLAKVAEESRLLLHQSHSRFSTTTKNCDSSENDKINFFNLIKNFIKQSKKQNPIKKQLLRHEFRQFSRLQFFFG